MYKQNEIKDHERENKWIVDRKRFAQRNNWKPENRYQITKRYKSNWRFNKRVDLKFRPWNSTRN